MSALGQGEDTQIKLGRPHWSTRFEGLAVLPPPPERGSYRARLLQHERLFRSILLVFLLLGEAEWGEALDLKKIKVFVQDMNDS